MSGNLSTVPKYSYIALEAYSRMVVFHNGVTVVADADGKYGLIRADESVAVSCQYEYMRYLAGNLYEVTTSAGHMIIDIAGKTLYGPTNGDVSFSVQNNTIRVREYNGESYVNTYYTLEMQPSTEAAYYGTDPFLSSLADAGQADLDSFARKLSNGNRTYRVWSDETQNGVVDYDGNWILPLGAYQDVGNTSPNGYVSAATYEGSSSAHTLSDIHSVVYRSGVQALDISGRLLSTNSSNDYIRFTSTGELYGLMNVSGSILLDETYTNIQVVSQDSNGNFTAYQSDEAGERQYSLFDRDVNPVFDRTYNGISYISGDLYRVQEGELYGVLRTNGEQVLPISYRAIYQEYYDSTIYFDLYDGNAYGLANASGNVIVSGAPGYLRLYYDWPGSDIDSLNAARRYSNYEGSVLALCAGSDSGDRYTTYYVDFSNDTCTGELPLAASNINADGLFAYWDQAKDAYGFGWLESAAATSRTISFNGNGSTSGSMQNQTVTAGQAAALTPNTFTREGYSFNGWNTAADGSGTAYADGASVSLTGDLTLYAQWEQNLYRVLFLPGQSRSYLFFNSDIGGYYEYSACLDGEVDTVYVRVDARFDVNTSNNSLAFSMNPAWGNYAWNGVLLNNSYYIMVHGIRTRGRKKSVNMV